MRVACLRAIRIRHGVLAILGALGLVGSSVSTAADVPPAEYFTKWPAIDDVVPSPSGKRLALLSFGPDGRRRLGVMDLPALGEPRIAAAFGDADVQGVRWVSDDRLVYAAARPFAEFREGAGGLFAVNHDGSAQRQLIAWQSVTDPGLKSSIAARVLPATWRLHATLDDGSDDVLVYRIAFDKRGDFKQLELARLNTTTGILQRINAGMPEGARSWLLDGKGEPRLLKTQMDGREKIYWRGAGSSAWTQLADYDPLAEPGIDPWFVDEAGKVLVRTRLGDLAGIYSYDPVARHIDPDPVLALPGFDLDGVADRDTQTGRLVGVHYRTERPGSYWFDDKLRRIQRSIDTALPDRINTILCGRCESSRFLVVVSRSDRQAGEYFLFDRSDSFA